jgi:hypothetical protein
MPVERRRFFARGPLTGVMPGLLRSRLIALFCGVIVTVLPTLVTATTPIPPSLLSDPFLQNPTRDSVQVVWFTEWEGIGHRVDYGENLSQTAIATSQRLSRTREDAQSYLPQPPSQVAERPIWRHQATILGLKPDVKLPYRAVSDFSKFQSVQSDHFQLSALPSGDRPLQILLTSDHQLMPMVAANLQKVRETVGQVDAVFFAGDLVNIPDRASEWFDDRRGGAFFPCLQGRASYALTRAGQVTTYSGAPIIQNAPLFPTIGNHEVMGRFSTSSSLNNQFENAVPRPAGIAEESQFLKDRSFNTDTYEAIFSLPTNSQGHSRYYALTFGNIRLIVLYVTNIWRSPDLEPTTKGRYRESETDFDHPDRWGYGQHIFESIQPDSEQYRWLQSELVGPEFARTRYKIVMFHHPPHTLGGNIVPPYTDPIQQVSRDTTGKITAIRYDYPIEKDYIIRDLIPLLEKAGVNLVFYGHSHLWNRFLSPAGTNFLETSNVGNSYGAHAHANPRPIPDDRSPDQYRPYGNPNGLEPIMPSIAPIVGEIGQKLPYVASNDITVFSILDTRSGTVRSYRFDTRYPDSDVIHFDEFFLDHVEDDSQRSPMSLE